MTASAPVQPELDLLRLEHEGAYPQRDFYDSAAFYAAYLGGIGTGKSVLLVADAFDYADAHAGSIQVLTEPASMQLKDVALVKVNELFGWARGKHYERNEAGPQGGPVDIEFRNGSRIWLRAADTVLEERHRGTQIARLLMDEVALGHQEAAFGTLVARVRQPGYPLQVKVAGTPKGRNWVWRSWFDQPLGDSAYYVAFTEDAERVGLLPHGYTERLAAQYGGWEAALAQQELRGSFVQMAGMVHPQFNRAVHCQELPCPVSALTDRLGGIDFGAVSPTALVCAGQAAGRGYAFGEWYKAEATMDQTAGAMADMEQRYGIKRWICDPAGKQQMEMLQRLGFRVQAARHGNKLELRTQLFGRRLNIVAGWHGLYLTSAVPNLISEVEGLAWRRVQLVGRTQELLTDAFERGCPDHAYDAATNVLSEWDAVRAPRSGLTEPVRVYGRSW